MCQITKKRKSNKFVYLHIIDGDMYSVKKMPIKSYEYAATFNNPDLLNAASILTNDRDVDDSYSAVSF